MLTLRLYTGLPPSAPTRSIPKIPLANILAQHIISSAYKIFFISRRIGCSIADISKWRFIHVSLPATMSSYPSCLKDGKDVVDFYVVHPSDFCYNTINQRFWLQYNVQDNLLGPCSSLDTHLICPPDTSKAYAKCYKQLPFHCFVDLTHSGTYIHGPFNFATIHGKKSCNWICQADWDMLWSQTSIFHNPIPSFEEPTHPVHVDPCAHMTFHDTCLSHDVCSSSQLGDHDANTRLNS